MHSELKRRGRILGLQRGGRQFTWRWPNKCLVNKCFLRHAETVGHRRSLVFKSSQITPPTPSPYSVVIPDDSVLPGPDPLSKFFQSVKVKNSSGAFLFFKNNQPEIILMLKRHIQGEKVLFPYSVLAEFFDLQKRAVVCKAQNRFILWCSQRERTRTSLWSFRKSSLKIVNLFSNLKSS